MLTGPPGAGKSALAPRLAERLGYAAVDLDRAVEAREGRTVAELFRERGDAGFRMAERALLRELLARPRVVIAAGGGALTDRALRHEALRRATVVSLTAPADVLFERLRAGEERPLLASGRDPRAALGALLDARREGYAEAHDRYDTSRLDADAVAREASRLHARAPMAVPLGERTYRVEVGTLAREHGAFDALLGREGRALLVTERRVRSLWGGAALGELPPLAGEVALPPGERHKTIASAARVWDALAARGADRGWLVVALGGGVVTDLAGFAAATYLRGVRYASAPTTLLAMVDASVGGKTGVDRRAGKNLVGAFHHPSLVWIDPRFTSTLPAREWRSGMAEALKVAVTLDAGLLDLIESHAAALREPPPREGDDPHAALRERVIRASVQAKIDVVSADEREAGPRAVLNFGHTVGHAVEHASGYRLRHGECVAVGMAAALELGVREGVTPPALRDRVVAVLDALGLPRRASVPRAEARAALRVDKKRAGSSVRFVLAEAAGRAVLRPLPFERVDAVLPAVTGGPFSRARASR